MEIPKQEDMFYSVLGWPDCLFYMSTLLTQDCNLYEEFSRESRQVFKMFNSNLKLQINIINNAAHTDALSLLLRFVNNFHLSVTFKITTHAYPLIFHNM